MVAIRRGVDEHLRGEQIRGELVGEAAPRAEHHLHREVGPRIAARAALVERALDAAREVTLEGDELAEIDRELHALVDELLEDALLERHGLRAHRRRLLPAAALRRRRLRR